MTTFVSRLAFAMGLALHLALASGASLATEEIGCTEQCPDDAPDGKCPPNCSYCPCCTHVRLQFVEAPTKEAPALVMVPVLERVEAPPLSPEPGEILHVPKASLA